MPDGHGTVMAGTVVPARLAYIALFVAVGASAPFLPVYYDSLGIDVRLIPLLASLMAGAGLFGSPLWGATADRFPHSRLVLPAAAVLAAQPPPAAGPRHAASVRGDLRAGARGRGPL